LAKEREIWQTVGSNKHKKSPVLLPSKNTSSDTKNTKQLSTLFSSLENVKGPITMLCNNVLEYKPENNEKVSTVTCKQDNSLTYNVPKRITVTKQMMQRLNNTLSNTNGRSIN
jgi:glutathione peroxidase-family protein